MTKVGTARGTRPAAVGAAFCLVLATCPAHASGPLGANGAPIRTSAYGVDLAQTPVVAGARVTGLAGAYVAIAEGIDGDIQTPVAPAVRTSYSVDHFESELGLGLTLPVTITSADFFNTGNRRTELADAKQEGFVFVTPQINLTWGSFGIGATAVLQNYTLDRNGSTSANARQDQLSAQFVVGHVQAAQAFADGQLVAGAGVRILGLSVSNPAAPAGQTDLFSTVGAGFELGGLWKPEGQDYRIGAAFRSAVSTKPDPQSQIAANAQGDRVIGDPADPVNAFWLPDRIEEPWDLNVGIAFQLGGRPFNPRWIDPDIRDDEAEQAILRRKAERSFRRDVELARLRDEGLLDDAARDAVLAQSENEEAIDELHVDRAQGDTRRALKTRFARFPRRYVLISMSLVVTGPVEASVGVESFLQRVVAHSGASTNYSPRLGVETELIPYWLKIRGGSYLEPTRFATSTSRLHGTFGFDEKVFPWTVFGLFDDGTEWRVSTSLDVAARFLGWGATVGVWH